MQDPEEISATDETLAPELLNGPNIESWMVDIAMKSLPYPRNQPANRSHVEKTLKQCNGSVNYAVSLLIPDSSPESSSRSSSIEREPDSDDEGITKPNKKRDRRVSRPHPLRNNLAIQVKEKDQLSPDPHSLAKALEEVSDKSTDLDATEEEDWQAHSQSDKTDSSSTTSQSDDSSKEAPKETGVRLKINPPKKQALKPTEGGPSNSAGPTPATASHPMTGTPIHGRIKAKPRRRLISGHQRNKELAEQAARNANNQKLDMRIQAIHI